MPTFDLAGIENSSETNVYASGVGAYYDACQFWYRAFYSDHASLAVHYGIWRRPSMTRRDALLEPYRIVLERLQPLPGQRILDAGCGVGGASRWLALQSGADFTGITASAVQKTRATEYVAKRGLTERVEFHCMDYHRTSFPDGYFDHVFGIESFCYSYPAPEVLFRELYRLLKPGGRLVMLDGILRRKPESRAEELLADAFCSGFSMRGWNTAQEIERALASSGFGSIDFEDQTPFIERSVKEIHWRHLLFRHLRAIRSLGLVPAAVLQSLDGTGVQKRMYEAGLLGYGLFCAQRG